MARALLAPHGGFVWMDTTEVAGVSGQVGPPLSVQQTTAAVQDPHPLHHEPESLLYASPLLLVIGYVCLVGFARRGIILPGKIRPHPP